MIFVLFCEDMGRQIAFPPQVLRDRLLHLSAGALATDGDDAWDMLRGLFRRMNAGGTFDGKPIQRFNGGLFAADPELEDLVLPNHVFVDAGQGAGEQALRAPRPNLLYFAANYNFGTTSDGRAITLYTLGRIFEQSITELEALEAAADERPSLTVITRRKRDGVYYTPEAVVSVIVEETVGAWLEDARRACGWDETVAFTREEIAAQPARVRGQAAAIERYQARLRTLTIVDPACGSGAFLIAALDYLLREFRRTAAARERLERGQFALFDDVAATNHILARNIHGVDINPASVELARLALWLHTARADSPLSDLDATVRDGNSLVGPDIANVNPAYALLPPAGQERINAFDWAAAFPDVFARGGFDCVVGNPPYVKLQNYRRVMPEVAEYLRAATGPVLGSTARRYASAQSGNTDLFLPFIEKGIALLREGGRMGYIAPSLWLLNEYGEGLRRLVHAGGHLDRWMDFRSHQIFEEAITYTALQFYTRARNDAVRFLDAPEGPVPPVWSDPDMRVSYAELPEGGAWTLLPEPERAVMQALMTRCDRLDSARVTTAIFQGLITSADDVYHLRKIGKGLYRTAAGLRVQIEDELMKPLISGKDVSRWRKLSPAWHILFPYSTEATGRMTLVPTSMMQRQFPLGWAYLIRHEAALRAREARRFDDEAWYRFGRNQGLDKQALPKLFVAQTVLQIEVALDETGAFAADNVRVNCILPANPADLWFLMAALHGRVCDWVFRRIAKPKQGGYFEANRQFVAPLPIPRADPAIRHRLGRLARIARALHTRRARVLILLGRRLEACAPRREPLTWLLAGNVSSIADLTREAPRMLHGPARLGWARSRQKAQIEVALDHAAVLLDGRAALSVGFEQGELRLNAGQEPVFDHIFIDDDQGPFIALQWRLKLRGRRESAATLAHGLCLLRRSENAALRDQALAAGRWLFRYDAMVARNERDLDAALAAAYALTPAEQAMIGAAPPR